MNDHRQSRRWARTALLTFLPLCLAQAQAVAPPQFFSVKTDPRYPTPQKILAQFVHARAKHPINHFCAVGYRNASNPKEDYAWLYWKEGNALILWSPAAANPKYPPPSLDESQRYLNLSKDVVPTETDLHNSTYLVTKKWVAGIKSDCEAHGDKFLVTKQSRR